MCVTVAQESIDLAFTRRSSDPNSVGPVAAWWYNVLFVYSAATVLVAAKLCPTLRAEFSSDSISRSWERAIRLLEHYKGFNPVTEQLIAALHLLYNVLPEHYQSAKETGFPESRRRNHHHQTFEAMNVGSGPQPSLDRGMELRSTARGDSPSNEEAVLDPSAMTPDRGFSYQDFDFYFDSRDLSWLNSMPFEM